MDYSTKVKTTTTIAAAAAAGATVTLQSKNRRNYRHSSETPTDAASSPLTSDQQDIVSYPCPACPIILTTPRELTNHIRGHNSPRSTDYSGEDDYTCGVCHKSLSSASSLDRHVLVHSGERPFKCKYCDMAFTTNGNMNRHLRTAHGTSPRETNGYTDSDASCDSVKSVAKKRHRNAIVQEYNNNEIGKRDSPDLSLQQNQQNQLDSPSRYVVKRKRHDFTDDEISDNPTRKHKIMLNDSRTELQNGDARIEQQQQQQQQQLAIVKSCPICGSLDYPTELELESHLEKQHPEHPVNCDICGVTFRNHRVLNLHKYMKHIAIENSTCPSNGRNLRNSVVGFNDLTFVDFSSDKFPTIARAVCEQSMHLPASGELTKFLCEKCFRAFPCRSALDSHEIDCDTLTLQQLSSSAAGVSIRCADERFSRRDKFFASLKLQNRAAMNEAKDGKDLADIQSIISVTSGPILQNFPRSDASTPEHQQIKPSSTIAGSSGSSGTASSVDYHQEEEAQDAFAAEFRRMKLKGEFPCRLCDAVFPNLRALKGHNRSHMGVGPGMPYPCNMCPYTSNDKGTLVRHLRSHNGDRPFECSLCHFAFTTKANCERHVRNRHGKATRDEIKGVIIYHPSEDSTNDSGSLDRQDVLGRREDVRKTLVYPASNASVEKDENSQRPKDLYLGMQFGNKTNPVISATDDTTTTLPISLQSMNYDKNMDIFARTPNRGVYPHETSQRMLNDDEDDDDYDDYDYEYDDNGAKSDNNSLRHGYNVNSRSSEDDGTISLVSDTKTTNQTTAAAAPPPTTTTIHQRVQASPIDLKKNIISMSCSTTNSRINNTINDDNIDTTIFPTGEDAPLDLSMDVLDLSKKSNSNNVPVISPLSPVTTIPNNNNNNNNNNNEETDFGRNQKEFYDATNQFLLTQALLKAGQAGNPATSLEALYANAHMIYRNFGGFSAAGVGAGILPPYLFNPHMFGQDFAIKDRLQKELVRGLQLTSGGNIVEPSIGNTAFAGAYPPVRETTIARTENTGDYGKHHVTSKLSLKLSNNASMRETKVDNTSQSPNSVKMVLKNGVLMPKQKQRRYRTERPFTCEHCSARFTLRSNMERHIKQQHPQHWSQRPRGGHSTRGRPPANPANHLTTVNNHSINRSVSQQRSRDSLNDDERSICHDVKYGIWMNQLHGRKIDENDTGDERLIIDEASVAQENREILENDGVPRTTSLLRGKLEGMNNLYKENLRSQQQQQQQQKVAPDFVKKLSNEEKTRHSDDETVETMEPEDCRKTTIKIETRENDEREIEENNDYCAPSQLCIAEMTKTDENTTTTTAAATASLSRDVTTTNERNEDLASVSELLDNASQQYQQFQSQYMSDEEGLVASTSDCNNSGSDEKSDSINSTNSQNSRTSSLKRKKKKKKKKMTKKKSAYSMAPNRVICPFCQRPFPWTSSLRRHILTHTGQKPFRCTYCSLLFTTKSNCDRHLLRKHKNNTDDENISRNIESPEPIEQTTDNNNTNNNNNNISSSNNNNNNNVNNNNNNNNNNSTSSAFAMRNVPERPYKCNLCPSSTFSTLGNLKKHKSSKHSRSSTVKSGGESPVTSEPRNSPIPTSNKQNDNSGYESQSSSASENMDHIDSPENLDNQHSRYPTKVDDTTIETKISDNTLTNDQTLGISSKDRRSDFVALENNEATKISENVTCQDNNTLTRKHEKTKSRRSSPRSSPGPTDGPFKCHKCDSGFSKRQDCLDHIKIYHPSSFKTLLKKGALNMDIDAIEEQQQTPSTSSLHQHTSDGEEKRGKFPDYSNRKVVCAFCMRRFWSAEDLRRHMRTHTGEKPFSCEKCHRHFTLKHSMLRHRKKHDADDTAPNVGTSGEEESAPSQQSTTTPRSQQQQQQQNNSMLASTTSCDSRLQDRISLPIVATVATGDAAPSELMMFNPYEKLTTLTGKMANAQQNFNANECPADTENDLISNLLGIRDKSIIDKVLQASPDDAAKLLGVNTHHD